VVTVSARGRGAAWLAHWPVKLDAESAPLGKLRIYRGVFLSLIASRGIELASFLAVTGTATGTASRLRGGWG